MIRVYGTSHVSYESIELIDEKLEQHDPDIVALELDTARLEALISDQDNSQGPIFIRLLRYFQQKVGEKTGVMPGDEMLHAIHRAETQGRDLALIDQDIRVTLQRLKNIRRKEKVKAAGSIFLGLLLPGAFDLSTIPKDAKIDELLEETKHRFPGIYRVLVQERNDYMAAALEQLQNEHPEKDIVAFVGAGHKEELRRMLEEAGVNEEIEDSSNQTLEDF